jgi:hypothetical protein
MELAVDDAASGNCMEKAMEPSSGDVSDPLQDKTKKTRKERIKIRPRAWPFVKYSFPAATVEEPVVFGGREFMIQFSLNTFFLPLKV